MTPVKKLPEYRSWKSMRDRCNNPKTSGYELYGGRGIQVQNSWKYFKVFLHDMGSKPAPHYQIDRIDPNGNYCKNNCRWVEPKVNANNRRNNRKIAFGGVVKNLSEWAELTGLSTSVISYRLAAGWDAEETLLTEKNHGNGWINGNRAAITKTNN